MTSGDVVGGVRKLIQDLVAPELQEIKGKLAGLEVRIAAAEIAVTARIEAVEKVFTTRLDALEKGMNTRFDSVDIRFNAVNLKLDLLLQHQVLENRIGSIERGLAMVAEREQKTEQTIQVLAKLKGEKTEFQE